MPFTDDDLAMFKHHYGHLSHCAALLARLEAAERLAECADKNDWFHEWKAWRKAAGKDKS